jgi:hypothetical protein
MTDLERLADFCILVGLERHQLHVAHVWCCRACCWCGPPPGCPLLVESRVRLEELLLCQQ